MKILSTNLKKKCAKQLRLVSKKSGIFRLFLYVLLSSFNSQTLLAKEYIILVFFHSLVAKGLGDLKNERHAIEIVYSDIYILNNVYPKGGSKIHECQDWVLEQKRLFWL